MTNEVHFDGKVAQKAVIVRDSKVLVVRDPRMGYEIWEIPGGRLNVGEDPKAGLAREIKEELGVDCVVGEVLHVTQFLQGDERKNALMIAYLAVIATDAEMVMAPGEVCEIRWVSYDEIEKMTFFDEYKDTLCIYFEKYHK